MSTEATAGITQYLSFTLDEEVFALETSAVKEVLEFHDVTKVPCMPDYMRGVINLRGKAIPVIDLRMKFGMPETEKSIDTCVIITDVPMGEGTSTIGALADSVREVFDLEDSQIEASPKVGSQINTDFLKGMGKKNEDFILILDMARVFWHGSGDMLKAPSEAEKEASVSIDMD